VALIESARAQGRRVELVSAAHDDLLRRWGGDIGFDAIFGSHDGVNLKGPAKARFLADRHPDGFAYVGDSAADLPVWRVAHERFGVELGSSVRRRLARENLPIHELIASRSWLPALLREMRPHQWAKNLLVFVSLGLDLENVTRVVIAHFAMTFVAFCMVTSGTYFLNDLTDLASDRLHPRKRFRPLASGALPISIGIPASVALMAGGLGLAVATSLHIGASVAAYLALTVAYSFGLKRVAILDVLTIATLFTIRIIAGAFGYEGPVSRWIIAFSLFLFTSLALMKRAAETATLKERATKVVAGRAYRAGDYNFLITSGLAFGVGAVIVFSLYVSEMVSGRQQYESPEALWLATGVLGYWILHMWLKTARDEMHDDPILYAVRDRVSLAMGAAIFLIAVLAQIL
jgi:4-hydroxybenzoate polyprenyltransferase